MEKQEFVTRFDEVRIRVSDPKQMVGKQLAESVTRKWTEDFIDEDTKETVQVERNEVIIGRGKVLTNEDVSKIQFYIQEGSVKDVLVTNQDRPSEHSPIRGMFEVVVSHTNGKRHLLLQARSISMAVAIAIDYCEQRGKGFFSIETVKASGDFHVVKYKPTEGEEAPAYYYFVKILYWDGEKNRNAAFLTLAKDADQAIDIVQSLIAQNEGMAKLYEEYMVHSAKLAPITEIVPVEMSERYYKFAATEDYIMGGVRVGRTAGDL